MCQGPRRKKGGGGKPEQSRAEQGWVGQGRGEGGQGERPTGAARGAVERVAGRRGAVGGAGRAAVAAVDRAGVAGEDGGGAAGEAGLRTVGGCASGLLHRDSMTDFIKTIAALVCFALFSFFVFVAAAAYSATTYQCPHGNDCHDARLAMMLGGALAAISLGLLIPLVRSIWRGVKGR